MAGGGVAPQGLPSSDERYPACGVSTTARRNLAPSAVSVLFHVERLAPVVGCQPSSACPSWYVVLPLGIPVLPGIGIAASLSAARRVFPWPRSGIGFT